MPSGFRGPTGGPIVGRVLVTLVQEKRLISEKAVLPPWLFRFFSHKSTHYGGSRGGAGRRYD